MHTMTDTKQIVTVAASGALVLASAISGVYGPSVRLSAQQPPQFDVASVKPNKSADNRVMIGMQPGGRFTATNVSARQLITNAYRVQPFQIVGGPSWIETDRFDIAAKGAGDVPPDQMQAMLRGLLAERFGLVAHSESRDMPIYALTLARPDGKLGPKMKESTIDCQALMGRGRGAAPGPPAPPPPTAAGGPPPCGMRIGPGSLSSGGMAIAQLTQSLGPMSGRVVQDRTGLTGSYDFELSWTPDASIGGGGGPLGGGGAAPPPSSDGGASLFTAIQEQLGLKLESTRGPVDVVVIDKISQPTPD
jgi:uncharacterized protein (TIGR03435 family)